MARYRVNVQAQGADGDTKAVQPTGTTYVAEGGALELAITGTPVALYDNGAEKSAEIADGKYVVTGVDGEHTIAVIF